MPRLLTLLMIITLVIGHGMSYAAAVCRHHNVQDHILAHRSRDSAVAGAAKAEEDSAKLAAKKAQRTGTNMAAWAADMLPRGSYAPPLRVAGAVPSGLGHEARLIGTSITPLLRPPLGDRRPV
ncbi:hypothetical protein [Sphingosinicella sp. BN140058]|uniref:hypothetical protein n=1 Tax=Sphingosinicella sp. BN140058 TaxID=1892855 RepID=UPI001012C947|nr:hypothetical protein [Sphingosinicella sp. BN140058]QAY75945.1 hypothetical protein ETR14_04940 [Sphingosinicella sp. BN140058]